MRIGELELWENFDDFVIFDRRTRETHGVSTKELASGLRALVHWLRQGGERGTEDASKESG